MYHVTFHTEMYVFWQAGSVWDIIECEHYNVYFCLIYAVFNYLMLRYNCTKAILKDKQHSKYATISKQTKPCTRQNVNKI